MLDIEEDDALTSAEIPATSTHAPMSVSSSVTSVRPHKKRHLQSPDIVPLEGAIVKLVEQTEGATSARLPLKSWQTGWGLS